MTTDKLTRGARTSLSVAQTFLMDGAPADALRSALKACEMLFMLTCRRYIPLCENTDTEPKDAKKTRS